MKHPHTTEPVKGIQLPHIGRYGGLAVALATALLLTTAVDGADRGLVLSPNWDNNLRNQVGADDMVRLLAAHETPERDLTAPATPITLYGPITYLMPFQEARARLRCTFSSRWSVTCPAFPRFSFFYEVFSGNFGDGYTKLILVCDAANQVVAVQLVDEVPRCAPSVLVDERWHTYDFVQSGGKANTAWQVGHRVQRMGNLLCIDTELIDPRAHAVREHEVRVTVGRANQRRALPAGTTLLAIQSRTPEAGQAWGGKVRERVRLYLPQPLARVILYHSQYQLQTAAR